MAYLAISDFKYGIDRRRERVSGVPGTLWLLENALITRGGDIERAKKFVDRYTLPAGTHGLARLRNQLWTFGSNNLTNSMPLGVQYKRLQAFSATMARVLDSKQMSGDLYTIAEYNDGSIWHFYGTTRVTDWDDIAANNSDTNTLAQHLADKINHNTAVTAQVFGAVIRVTAKVPGTAFTLSTAAVNGGVNNTQAIANTTVVANVVEVEEVRGTATVEITGGSFALGNTISNLTVNVVPLITSPVSWIDSNSSTANALATAINNKTAIHGYKAQAAGAIVTLTAPAGTGATVNGHVVAVTETGSVTTTTSGAIAGGVTAVAPVAQVSSVTFSGTWEGLDQATITIDGTDYKATRLASGMGTACFVHKKRMWVVAGTQLIGSALDDPSDFSTPDASSGFVVIDVSAASEGTDRLTGLGEYSNYLAVFAPNSIRLFAVNTDATEISFYQALDNTGTKAGRSVAKYGNNDVFYLDTSGIRSIRQRDVIGTAFVADVGMVIDPYVREQIVALSSDVVARAVATIEPIDSRFMLALDDRVYVFSAFETAKIAAWSVIDQDLEITDFVRVGDELYARAGDAVYLYGGTDGTEYPGDDEFSVSFETPFLTANLPATEKQIIGFDIACSNEWEIDIYVDPNDETKVFPLGTFYKTTYAQPNVGVSAQTTHFAFKGICNKGGRATVSSLALHFDKDNSPQ